MSDEQPTDWAGQPITVGTRIFYAGNSTDVKYGEVVEVGPVPGGAWSRDYYWQVKVRRLPYLGHGEEGTPRWTYISRILVAPNQP